MTSAETALRRRRPHTTGRRKIVHALLPARMAHDLRQYAAARGWSTAETAGLVLADFVLALRRKRTQPSDRAAVLDQLKAMGCTFTGAVERRHRRLARQLEKLDADTDLRSRQRATP
ncbi:MAG: hypothetical protein IH974_01100 [Myxococcales bacterium]|nr:hypothetical protein [Myxococcales bacterium]